MAKASILKDFIKSLPSHNPENFSKFQADPANRYSVKSPPTYLPTVEIPSEQVIVNEETHVLLRYLHKQWEQKEEKARNKKRGTFQDGQDNGDNGDTGEEEATAAKRARTSSTEAMTSNE